MTRPILWLKPTDKTVPLRDPTPTWAKTDLELTNGSAFIDGDDFEDLNLTNFRCTTSRNYPASNPSETVGQEYKASAIGVLSAKYDIRYKLGKLTVV